MNFLRLLLPTLLLRPYVFIFLIVFLVTGFLNMGRRRTLVFFLITWVITYVCEYSSTRNGFPFGLYTYTETTKGQELFLSNIPFFDSLSFTFLLYAAFSTSLFLLSPLRIQNKNVQVSDTFAIRQGKAVLFLSTLLMMMIDVVIDPIALRGDKWFLGKIYYYNYPGSYFGVPLTNAIGWAVVGFASLWIYQQIEKSYLSNSVPTKKNIPYQSLMGMGLYYGVLLFMLSICAYIQEPFLLIASSFIFILPTSWIVIRFFDQRARATEDEWKKHCENFPST